MAALRSTVISFTRTVSTCLSSCDSLFLKVARTTTTMRSFTIAKHPLNSCRTFTTAWSAGLKPGTFALSGNNFSGISSAIHREFSSGVKGIQTQISSLQAKKRTVRKRVTKPDETKIKDEVSSLNNGGILFNQDTGTVIAYATAEEYNLEGLNVALHKQGLYQPSSMPEDVHDVLHVSAKYQVGREPREIYIFREGSLVMWNVPDAEREVVLDFLKDFEESSYNRDLVIEENEIIEYTYTDNKTRLVNGRILLNSEGSTDLEKYTFSNAMALSVKLALWEASLDQYVDTIEYVTEDMKLGKPIRMSRQQVLRKMGELFALRHLINLSSDLLDTPDFYWDRETLEALYHKTCNHLNISKRTRVMNEKLNHCSELIQLLSDHLNDRHHIRLEVMIIVLIMIEVLFELMHFVQGLFDSSHKRAEAPLKN